MSWKRLGTPKHCGGMGFRGLEVFNRALLAKQGWKLISCLDTLLARILRERYYLGGVFLEAQASRCPSFAWRSIIGAKKLLENRVGWTIGNGKTVKIWGDAWLPPPHSRLLIPPCNGLGFDSRVDSLIDTETGRWNLNLLNRCFPSADVEMIGSVIISPLGQDDKMEMRRLSQERGESSGSHGGENVWKSIWDLKAPPVLRNFCWKVSNNLLPNMVNLLWKKIVSNSLCPICTREPESTFHSLWRCLSAEAVWQKCSRRIQKLSCEDMDGRGLLLFFFENLSNEEVLEAITVARMIWLRRNSFVFGRGFSIR